MVDESRNIDIAIAAYSMKLNINAIVAVYYFQRIYTILTTLYTRDAAMSDLLQN